MRRYARLFLTQLRASTLLALQYRADFLGQSALALAWTAASVVPWLVVAAHRPGVAGWSVNELLVVLGWFTLMKGVLDGAINPSLNAVVEHIRKGTLDFVLLKPADAQFLVSTARFAPWHVVDVAGGIGLVALAFHRMGRTPAPAHVVAAAALLVCAALTMYALWILVICAAFVVVKVDNLSFLLSSVFDAARWPSSVFRGFWRFLFTFVVPLALMTTYPALAILGRLDLTTAGAALLGAAVFGAFARLVWLRAIGHYTSASS